MLGLGGLKNKTRTKIQALVFWFQLQHLGQIDGLSPILARRGELPNYFSNCDQLSRLVWQKSGSTDYKLGKGEIHENKLQIKVWSSVGMPWQMVWLTKELSNRII